MIVASSALPVTLRLLYAWKKRTAVAISLVNSVLPSFVMTNDGRTEFTKDIATAVRFFQAYNNLSVTGRADEATIKALKTKAQ